jgi:hypothetical protein
MLTPWKAIGIAAAAQVVVILGIAIWWFYLRTVAYLAGPTGPDLYAHTWEFQLIVGALFLFGVVVGIVLLLLVEAVVIAAISRRHGAHT